MENWLLFAVFCYEIRFESLDVSLSNLRENLKGREVSIQTVQFLNLVTNYQGRKLSQV